MLRIIQRCLGRLRPKAASGRASETTVLLVRVPIQPAAAVPLTAAARPLERSPTSQHAPPTRRSSQPPSLPQATPSLSQASQGRRAAAKADELALPALGLFSPKMLGKLRRAGLRSSADLLAADPQRVVKRIGVRQHWVAKLRRYQRAIRFASSFTEMTPHDALLLFAAHRRSHTRLATESAGILKRDLERLLLSSRGQKLAGGRPVPELDRVRAWIRQAQAKNERRKLKNRENRSSAAEKTADRANLTALAADPALPNGAAELYSGGSL